MWENWCLLQWLYLNVTLWCQTSLKSTLTCHCAASLTFEFKTSKPEDFRLGCSSKPVGHPHSRSVFYRPGVNTASVSLWCANIKAASEPLVTEKKIYLKIKLYPSLSRTEKSTRCPAFFIPPLLGSSDAEWRRSKQMDTGLPKPQRHSVLRFTETDMVNAPVFGNTQLIFHFKTWTT